MYKVIIDSIKEDGWISCAVDREEGRIRCAFNPCNSLQDVLNFIEKHAPGYDCQEVSQQVQAIWQKDIIEKFKCAQAALEAQRELEQKLSEAEELTRLEIQYAEEQAWIENTVRDLFR